MGAKIPQRSSPRHGPILRLPHIESYSKTAHQTEGTPPGSVHTHIQLVGDDLTKKHIFILLSGLLRQTLYAGNYNTYFPFCQDSSLFQKNTSWMSRTFPAISVSLSNHCICCCLGNQSVVCLIQTYLFEDTTYRGTENDSKNWKRSLHTKTG